MKIKKQWVSWEELEAIQGGDWTPSAHTHIKADIIDTPWAWADVLKAGSNLTDLATRQHAGLSDAPANAHHPQLHAASHHVGGGDLLAFASITGFATYLDQAVKQASSVQFANGYFTGSFRLGALYYSALQTLSIGLGTETWINLCTVPTVTYIRLKVFAGSTNSQEVSEIEVLGTHYNASTGIKVKRQTYNEHLREVRVTGSDGGLKTIYIKIRNTLYAPNIQWRVLESKDAVTINNVEASPSGGVALVVSGDLITSTNSDMSIYGKVGIGKFPTCELDVEGTIKATQFYLNLGGLLDVTLGSLEEGETIRYDQATTKWIDAWGIDYDNPRLVYKIYTDFFNTDNESNDPWIGAFFGGGGSTVSVAGTADHPGIIEFYSIAAIGSGYRFMTSVNCILIAGAEHSEFIFKTPVTLDNSFIRLGYQDSLTSTAPTDGVYLNMSGATLTGKTRNNGTESTTGTGHPLSASTWYRGKIAVNRDADEVIFILYSAAGAQLWSQTLSTNIPIATGRETGHGVVTWVGIGSERRLISLDMMIATRAGYITR